MAHPNPVRLFSESGERTKKKADSESRANELSGKDWTRYSISVWNDIRKTPEEAKLGHPAMFPGSLVERLLVSFTKTSEKTVLDPFCGSGATLAEQDRLLTIK
jgi:DNA modification methylase